MAKIARKTQKIFCGNPTEADQTSVYGTMVDNATRQYSTDVEVLQSNPAYEEGWKSAVQAGYKPFMEDFNTLNYINTSQLAYIFQQGIPEWDDGTTYYTNSFCSYLGKLWKSLINDNLNNTPEEGEKWTEFKTGDSGKGAGLELCDIGLALFVDESKGLRRYLNGSILEINTNTQAFLTRLQQITTLYPNLACTEEQWQSAKTLSKLGQVGKFVYNYDDDGTTVVSVRLPLVKNINGLIDLANCGMTISESLPNITGYAKLGGVGSSEIAVSETTGALSPANSVNHMTRSENASSGMTSLKFNASGSSSTYQDNAPVQQEAIQYPYFIQIATGQETQNDIINEIQLNNPYTLFDSKYADAPLYNLSWLASNGQYNSGTVYVKAYEALLVEQNTEITVGTTVTLPSGTQYTKRGLSVKLGTELYSEYDFVIITDQQTFRLPLKNGQEGVFEDYKTVPEGYKLYYYVGETTENANLINASRIAEDMVSNKNLVDVQVIINTYINGTSGYRIWSDGYCEQWGVTGTSTNTITLLLSFADTNYNIQFSQQTNTQYQSIKSKTVNGFVLQGSTSYQNWVCRGYLAEGEY